GESLGGCALHGGEMSQASPTAKANSAPENGNGGTRVDCITLIIFRHQFLTCYFHEPQQSTSPRVAPDPPSWFQSTHCIVASNAGSTASSAGWHMPIVAFAEHVGLSGGPAPGGRDSSFWAKQGISGARHQRNATAYTTAC